METTKDYNLTRFISLFNNIPDMVLLIDPKNYSIIDANNTFLKKEGMKKREIIGKECYKVSHQSCVSCHGSAETCPLKKTLKTNKTARVEHIHYDKNNNPYYVEIITTFVKDPLTKKKLILHISRTGPFLRELSKLVRRKSKKYLSDLKRLVIKDPLTNVYNYRYLMERIPAEIYRAKRYDYHFSLCVIDIDYFKSINDVYGHTVGDHLLLEFAKFVDTLLRQSDILARYGGEEFIILMTHTDKLGAEYFARRLINKINKHVFRIKKLNIKLRASVGIATLSDDPSCDSYEKLLIALDKALDRAKETGGNVAIAYSALYKDKKETASKMSMFEEVKHLKRRIKRLTERVDRVVLESMYAFSKSLEARDYYTAEHAEDMVSLVLRIGKEIGLDENILSNLERGAMLHDLGKIGISDSILRKKAKLTPEEYRIIKSHPKIGAEIIRAIHFLKDVVPIVLHHHERWDGRGYPSGLKGKEIPLTARIVAIADAYQALMSDRPYRKAYSKKEALSILKEEAGVNFDKELVNVLVRLETTPLRLKAKS